MTTHLAVTRRAWATLEKAKNSDLIVINGDNGALELAHIVAVARCVVTQGVAFIRCIQILISQF